MSDTKIKKKSKNKDGKVKKKSKSTEVAVPVSDTVDNRSLAVRWRPKDIDDLVGQTEIINKFRGMLKTKKIPGAILLVGPTGCGKTTVSQMIARYVNCETMNACGKCQNCLMPIESHPDYEQVNASEKRGIDDVRAIIQRSKNRPRLGNLRILHLDEVHQLTPQAAEALLVPLEKPPEQTLYILSTTDPQMLKQTMRNRCVPMNIQLVPTADVIKRIKFIAGKENIKIGDSVIEHLANLSQGYMRDSVQLLEAVQMQLANNSKLSDDELKVILSNNAQAGGQEGLDDLAIKVLTACYGLNRVGVAKYMLDLRTDWVPFLSKCIWLNQYIVDAELTKNMRYHPNVWHNPLNKRFASVIKNSVEGFDPGKGKVIEMLASLQRTLIDLRQKCISGGIASVERMMITSHLIGWVVDSKKG